MGRNKDGRPEWFKFWRRNRRQLDIEQLNMHSRGVLFTNMMRYFDTGEAELIEMTPVEAMAFNIVKINVDDSFSEYKEREERNRENGQKGGRPAKNPKNPVGFLETDINPENPKIEERSQKKEVRSQKKEVETGAAKLQRTRFIQPTFEEIQNYCIERQNDVDPQRFIDYYTANGWKVGKNQMKDWRAAVRTWERRDKDGRNHDNGNTDQEIPGVTRL